MKPMRHTKVMSSALFALILIMPISALAAPRIQTSGGPFVASILTGARHQEPLTISNTGDRMLKFQVTVNAGDETWLRLTGDQTLISGNLAPGNSTVVWILTSAPALDCSVTHHLGGFRISHDDPMRNPLVFTAEVNVISAPEIWFNSQYVTFGIHHDIGDFEPQPVTIFNMGCEPLVVIKIWNDFPLIFQLPMNLPHILPLTLDPGENFTFLVGFFPPAYGQYVTGLFFQSNDPDETISEIQMDGCWTFYPAAGALATEPATWGSIKTLFH